MKCIMCQESNKIRNTWHVGPRCWTGFGTGCGTGCGTAFARKPSGSSTRCPPPTPPSLPTHRPLCNVRAVEEVLCLHKQNLLYELCLLHQGSPVTNILIIKCRSFYLPREFTAALVVVVYLPPSSHPEMLEKLGHRQTTNREPRWIYFCWEF